MYAIWGVILNIMPTASELNKFDRRVLELLQVR
jgi:hypothetical protein